MSWRLEPVLLADAADPNDPEALGDADGDGADSDRPGANKEWIEEMK